MKRCAENKEKDPGINRYNKSDEEMENYYERWPKLWNAMWKAREELKSIKNTPNSANKTVIYKRKYNETII